MHHVHGTSQVRKRQLLAPSRLKSDSCRPSQTPSDLTIACDPKVFLTMLS